MADNRTTPSQISSADPAGTDAALRESEDRFRYIIKYDPNAIAVMDRDLRYVFVSDRFLNDYRVSEQDVIGRCHYDVFPEMPQRWKDVHQRVLAGEVIREEEDAFVRRDGSIDYNRWECRPWYDAQGNIGGLIMYTEVITERKRAEMALRASEERFRGLVEATSDWVWAIDRSGRYTYASPKIKDLLGYEPQEVIGLQAFDLMPPDEAQRLQRLVRDDMAAGRPISGVENVNLHKDGRLVVLETSAVPIFDAAGQLQGYRGIDRDITERKLAAEQLKALNETLEQRVAERTAEAEWRASQLQRLAGELTQAEQRERQRLGQVLHDNLQQLLVAAKFNVDSLRRRLADPEQQRFIQKVDELLGESLATSRSLTAELSPPILYEGDLAQVLHWLGRRAKEKHGLSVTVTADEQADPASQEVRVLLFQAVRELLLNITKHAGVDRASISLDRLDSDNVRILVADDGAGFDPARKQTEQAGASSASRFGLFSIRERLELLGGSMEIASESGRGTRILLVAPSRLPGTQYTPAGRAAAEMLLEAVAPPGQAALQDGKVLRIMLADDHAVVRDGLARLLQTQPEMEVVGQAADGQEAVTLALQLRPDVILMDVSMPVMNGVEATRRIASQLPDTRVIGLSMHAQEDVAAQMKAAGATGYLTKTAPPETLIAAIHEQAARTTP